MKKTTVFDEIILLFNEYLNYQINEDKLQQELKIDYMARLNSIKTRNDFELFYKIYIINYIYLDLEQYNNVYKNCNKCLELSTKFSEEIKQHFKSELLFLKFYKIVLNEYLEIKPAIDIITHLKMLKIEIDSVKEGNTLLKEIKTRINIYLYTLTDKSEHLEDNLLFENLKDDFNFNNFKYFCENTASKIFHKVVDKHKLISHYTNISNSFNILNYKQLWVSRYDFLNDKSEVKYIIEILQEIIEEVKDRKSKSPFNDKEEHKFMQNQITLVKKIISAIFGVIPYKDLNEEEKFIYDTTSTNYFVLSFCKNKDSLSMWGNYTEFNGCNLSFKTKDFLSYFAEKHKTSVFRYLIKHDKNTLDKEELFSSYYYGDVSYNKDKIKKELIENYKETLRLHINNTNVIKEFVVTRLLIELTLIRGLFSKVNYFIYEEEFRVVFSLYEELYEKNVNFRSSLNNYIPFIKIPININSLSNINVGPRNSSDLAIKGFNEYLKHKYGEITITVGQSKIPFR